MTRVPREKMAKRTIFLGMDVSEGISKEEDSHGPFEG